MASNLNSTNDVYRFVSRRNPQTYDPKTFERRFIQFENLVSTKGVVYSELENIYRDHIASGKTAVREAHIRYLIGSNPYYLKPKILLERAQGYELIYYWVSKNNTATIDELKTQLDKCSWLINQQVLSGDNFSLLQSLIDSFIVYHFLRLDKFLQNEMIKVIRLFWIYNNYLPAEFRGFDETLLNDKTILEAINATIILPERIFFILDLFQNSSVCEVIPEPDPCSPNTIITVPNTLGKVHSIGYGDLKVVKTQLLKYDTGEVAHIENILKGESKSRVFRTLKRIQTTDFAESETTTQSEKETQTTDRFELESEISRSIKESTDIKAGITVDASYGFVDISANASYATTSAKEESSKVATKTAKELVNKAVEKITQRVKKQRTVVETRETEETNTHGINNENGLENISGIYRWVDKYYNAWVEDYGKRLMFEFIIPEPAAFYIFSKLSKKVVGKILKEPLFPKVYDESSMNPDNLRDIRSFEEIDTGNYAQLAAQYNVEEITIPPLVFKTITTSIGFEEVQNKYSSVIVNKEINIPEGYSPKKYTVACHRKDVSRAMIPGDLPIAGSLICLVGNHRHQLERQDGVFENEISDFESNITETIFPISVLGNLSEFIVNIEIKCEVTTTRIREWQKTTFNAIMAGYQRKKIEYEDWLISQQYQESISIQGNNPEINREIERTELKKSCLEIFTGQRFKDFNALRINRNNQYPEFAFQEAFKEGEYIQFFEQAFEWEHMTYLFYPYFWSRKNNWVDKISLKDTDPLFEKFLQAGSVRVVLPVHRAYEPAILYYQETGDIWNGGDPPAINDPTYISIADEIKEQSGYFEGVNIEPEKWVIKIPTDLVYLQPLSEGLPNYSSG